MRNREVFQERIEALTGHGSNDYNTTRMGENLWSMLESMAEKGGWGEGSGWTWSNTSTTTRMCESLVKRGFVTAEDYVVRTTRGGQYGGIKRRHYVTDPAIVAISHDIQRERDREYAEGRKKQEYATNLAHQDREARAFAVNRLIEANPALFESAMLQYKAEHPVEEVS
jgi:hypothetical protein